MVTEYYMTPVNPSTVIASATESKEQSEEQSYDKLSLTAAWDYVIRTQCLPENLDLDVFFATLHERLKSPEWEVRQNALRVLVDFMPLLKEETLDGRISMVMPDLVQNLGHLGPAVRKGAVDALKTYLNLSVKPNAITRDLVEWGVERDQENKIPTNVVLGVIMCLPFVINSKLNDTTINYIIHRLLDKIVKVVHQETVLRALVRIRDLIGGPKFDAALSTHETYNCKRSFELLCDVYDLHMFNTSSGKLNRIQKSETETDSDENVVRTNENDKVILETEIQLDSGSSITMKIHEENTGPTTPESNRANTQTQTFKVLPDLSIDDSYIETVRRTPRRVRFGGEIVKLRTPDSDSNIDDNDATISIISDGDQPVIEIKYIESETKTTTTTSRSLIPIPVKHTQSAPASPTGNSAGRSFARSKEYRSSPNLSKKISPTWGKSRIPRRRLNTDVRKTEETKETKIEININDSLKPPELPKKKKLVRRNTFSSGPTKVVPKSPTKPLKKALRIPKTTIDKNKEEFNSPTLPKHSPIELFHNLTRTPSPKPPNSPLFQFPPITASTVTKPSHDETPVGPKKQEQSQDLSKPIDPRPTNLPVETIIETQLTKSPTKTSLQKKKQISEDTAFHIYTSSEGPIEDPGDSPIPVNNSGDCLTCSSSGSEVGGVRVERFRTPYLSDSIVADLQNMDDIEARRRGLEELLRAIRTPTVLDALQDRLPSLLYILFSAVQQQTLHSTADETLTVIFSNMKQEALMDRLQQICLSLSKLGSPSGIRLAIVLMRRVPPKLVVDQLLGNSIIGAKSSKVREGALQIVMAVSRIYPSTELNILKSIRAVIKTLSDKKRKVRQAALETLAALAQITGNSTVLEVAQEVTSAMESPERQQILQVIRTRLSRKQLPTVNLNGMVQYSTALGDSEIEWLSKGHSTSSSPSSPYLKSAINSNTDIELEEELESSETLKQEDRNNNRVVKKQERFIQRYYPRSAQRFENHTPRSVMSAQVSQDYQHTSKINYWKHNPRNFSNNDTTEEIDSDWSSHKEESHEGQLGNRTQVWAIDPSAFTNAGGRKLSASGSLRELYLVKNARESKTTATNTEREPGTPRRNERNRVQRGRSFSPPTGPRLPDRDSGQLQSQRTHQSSYTPAQPTYNHGRFINGSHHERHYVSRNDGQEPMRKSFSSEQISGLDRFRKEHTFSSGSSSSSTSMRQSGNWRDLRSGIPVPIYDTKLRIRTKNANNAGKKKGPMTIPYYPPVKSPSPRSTSDKHDTSSNRQPFSSGSESSGYFTPPPETQNERIGTPDLGTPTLTPEISPQPERFVQIASPRKLESEPDSFDDVDDIVATEVNPPSNPIDTIETVDTVDEVDNISLKTEFRSSSSLNNLNYVERTLSKNETTNSLEFSKVAFDDLATSHRTIDVGIVTHIQRKNISSAPALNDSSGSFPITPRLTTTAKTQLPGSASESIDDTEAPEELYKSVSPVKRSPVKAPIKSSLARRKSSKCSGGKCSEANGDRPFTKPREAFHDVCAQLESTEWEVTIKGLQGLIRLIRHHRDVVENQMHAVCVMLGKHVRNLRSQVARSACYASMELAKMSRRPLEMELDEIATPLLHRTADTNKFLRGDANAALDEMSSQLSVPKLVAVITYRGCLHQNAVVRSASARLLCNIVQRLGAEKVFQLPRDTRDKILLAGANGLMEGSLETRQHAKMLLGLLSEHSQFQKAMTEAVPATILRHIEKTMKLLVK